MAAADRPGPWWWLDQASPLRRRGRWFPAPPMWQEARVRAERRALLQAPVFAGVGVPAGRGRPVLLIPGFLGGDASLQVLQGWLRRASYRPDTSGISFNIQRSDALVAALAMRARELRTRSGQAVTVVG